MPNHQNKKLACAWCGKVIEKTCDNPQCAGCHFHPSCLSKAYFRAYWAMTLCPKCKKSGGSD